jgi:hypothetical protein
MLTEAVQDVVWIGFVDDTVEAVTKQDLKEAGLKANANEVEVMEEFNFNWITSKHGAVVIMENLKRILG